MDLLEALSRATLLEECGDEDEALDLIWDSFDDILLEGGFQEVADLFPKINLKETGTDTLFGLLTVLFVAKEKIPGYEVFSKKCRKELVEVRKEVTMEDLKGLL